MIIIAESGSTKTDWYVTGRNEGSDFYINSKGIHPFFSSKEEVFDEVRHVFKEINTDKVEGLFFYGPGCAQLEQKKILKKWFSILFAHAAISIETDLLAAARGAFGNSEGVICILGTGSNAGRCADGNILEMAPSLGYLFGDEGSGAYIGKTLLDDVLNNNMPPAVLAKFEEAYPLSHREIITRVYSAPFPNRYLASFVPFVVSCIHLTYCRTLVDNAFEAFFIRRLMLLDNATSSTIRFVGSVAAEFADILIKVANRHDIILSLGEDIMKSPLDGLIRYHKNNF